MANDTTASDFSSAVQEVTINTVKSVARNLTRSASFFNASDISPIEEEPGDLEITTLVTSANIGSLVTNRAKNFVATAIRNISTTTISTTKSISTLTNNSFIATGHSSSSSNPFDMTHVPDLTTPTIYEVHGSRDNMETITNEGPNPTHHASLGDSNGNENESAHASMQNHIQNLNSPKSIKYLIQVS